MRAFILLSHLRGCDKVLIWTEPASWRLSMPGEQITIFWIIYNFARFTCLNFRRFEYCGMDGDKQTHFPPSYLPGEAQPDTTATGLQETNESALPVPLDRNESTDHHENERRETASSNMRSGNDATAQAAPL